MTAKDRTEMSFQLLQRLEIDGWRKALRMALNHQGFSLQLGKRGKRRPSKEPEERTKEERNKGKEAKRTKTKTQGIPTRKIGNVIERAPV